MEKAAAPRAGHKTDAEYRAELDDILAGIDQAFNDMRRDRAKIDQLKLETRTIAERTDGRLAEIRDVLNGMRTPGC